MMTIVAELKTGTINKNGCEIVMLKKGEDATIKCRNPESTLIEWNGQVFLLGKFIPGMTVETEIKDSGFFKVSFDKMPAKITKKIVLAPPSGTVDVIVNGRKYDLRTQMARVLGDHGQQKSGFFTVAVENVF